MTGFAKTLHFCTKTESIFTAQDHGKSHPYTVSLLANVNWSTFLEGIECESGSYGRHRLGGWDLELLPLLARHFVMRERLLVVAFGG